MSLRYARPRARLNRAQTWFVLDSRPRGKVLPMYRAAARPPSTAAELTLLRDVLRREAALEAHSFSGEAAAQALIAAAFEAYGSGDTAHARALLGKVPTELAADVASQTSSSRLDLFCIRLAHALGFDALAVRFCGALDVEGWKGTYAEGRRRAEDEILADDETLAEIEALAHIEARMNGETPEDVEARVRSETLAEVGALAEDLLTTAGQALTLGRKGKEVDLSGVGVLLGVLHKLSEAQSSEARANEAQDSGLLSDQVTAARTSKTNATSYGHVPGSTGATPADTLLENLTRRYLSLLAAADDGPGLAEAYSELCSRFSVSTSTAIVSNPNIDAGVSTRSSLNSVDLGVDTTASPFSIVKTSLPPVTLLDAPTTLYLLQHYTATGKKDLFDNLLVAIYTSRVFLPWSMTHANALMKLAATGALATRRSTDLARKFARAHCAPLTGSTLRALILTGVRDPAFCRDALARFQEQANATPFDLTTIAYCALIMGDGPGFRKAFKTMLARKWVPSARDVTLVLVQALLSQTGQINSRSQARTVPNKDKRGSSAPSSSSSFDATLAYCRELGAILSLETYIRVLNALQRLAIPKANKSQIFSVLEEYSKDRTVGLSPREQARVREVWGQLRASETLTPQSNETRYLAAMSLAETPRKKAQVKLTKVNSLLTRYHARGDYRTLLNAYQAANSRNTLSLYSHQLMLDAAFKVLPSLKGDEKTQLIRFVNQHVDDIAESFTDNQKIQKLVRQWKGGVPI